MRTTLIISLSFLYSCKYVYIESKYFKKNIDMEIFYSFYNDLREIFILNYSEPCSYYNKYACNYDNNNYIFIIIISCAVVSMNVNIQNNWVFRIIIRLGLRTHKKVYLNRNVCCTLDIFK